MRNRVVVIVLAAACTVPASSGLGQNQQWQTRMVTDPRTNFVVLTAPNAAACSYKSMRPLTAQEAFEHQQALCKGINEWEIWGLAGGGAMGGSGYQCQIHKKFSLGVGGVLCVAGPPPRIADKALVARFAPELKFDLAAAAKGYPMSPQPFFDKLTKDRDGNPVDMPGDAPLGVENTLNTQFSPTYYQVRVFGNQVRIQYWWFYGYQHPCSGRSGAHNGDWERVLVILKEDRSDIAAVVYFQHGGWYTRIAGPRDAPCTPGGTGRCTFSGFRRDGEHPIVYVGKISHGSFHDDNPAGGGIPLDGPQNCAYYADYRNPGSAQHYLRTWNYLVDLDEFGEPWMLKDNWAQHFPQGGGTPRGEFAHWNWGPSGISTYPTQNPPVARFKACDGSPTYAMKDAGCYKSECMAGDDEASEDCLKECKPGYTNHGLTCWKSAFHLYGRLQEDHWYRYPFVLPTNDVGLTRRRRVNNGDEYEWDAP